MDFIYALIDPRDNQIRYIGKTSNPERRLAAHLIEKQKSHKNNWIKGLLTNGFKPVLTIIEEVPDGQSWEDRECYWIAYYRSLDCKLTNMTDGGEKGPDCTGKVFVRSEIGKQNISAALAKRNRTPKARETSRRNGQRLKGRKRPAELIERQSKWMTGRKHHTEEFKQALAERNRTREYNPEIMKKSARKLWDDPIKGAELRARFTERNKSEEFKKAVAEGIKNRSYDSEALSERARKMWDDPIKGPELRKRITERNKARQYNPETMRANSRKGWDDPVKGPELRKRQSERMKDRYKKSKSENHSV